MEEVLDHEQRVEHLVDDFWKRVRPSPRVSFSVVATTLRRLSLASASRVL
jgi:2-polyprenyl-3-methyl-5-hydroxy-6-metoxy-1,4-benzoquinol methylase